MSMRWWSILIHMCMTSIISIHTQPMIPPESHTPTNIDTSGFSMSILTFRTCTIPTGT
jgi:hypothetical protein